MCTLKRKWRLTPTHSITSTDDESDEIRKIKKVQSFFRGWLCRRRWKNIVAEYINSPHAENMRKRNSLVFRYAAILWNLFVKKMQLLSITADRQRNEISF